MARGVPTSFRIPDELWARVDAARGDMSRNAWVIAAMEAYLVRLDLMRTYAHRLDVRRLRKTELALGKRVLPTEADRR